MDFDTHLALGPALGLGPGAFLGVATVSLVMVLTPGPNMIHLVSRSVAQGRRAGLISLAGIGFGFLVYLGAAVAGLAALFAAVPALYEAVKIAGACYLLWLAWQAVRPGSGSVLVPGPDAPALAPHSPLRLWSTGAATTLLNPKIAIMYASLLPQFTDPERGDPAVQSLVLGGVQIAISLSIDAVYVFVAGSLVAFLSGRPVWLRVQRWVTGTLLAGFGLRVATTD
ncbi:LysE family translocator (plasmid) [Streptomyces sp. BI20]|uniref:LysE family translocator n=1 Tax=Streptomyces sp. BI20 TaxID=3403460 RepID=UPI003C71BB7C